MPTNTIFGLILGFLIGACCRWYSLPLPAPKALFGALLVFIMTLGYLLPPYLAKMI